MIGMFENPGIADIAAVTLRSSSPDSMKVCPSRNSTSVSARRVESAGTVKPEMVTALE